MSARQFSSCVQGRTDTPDVPARVVGVKWDAAQLVIKPCPFCGLEHLHGDSPERAKPGARIPRGSHCDNVWSGYTLVVEGSS